MTRIVSGLALAFTLIASVALAVEEPAFTIVISAGAFEVRDYPALTVAQVTVGGDRRQAVTAGFRLLAGYIFGGNRRRRSIPMTAPVVQTRAEGQAIPMTAPVVQTRASGAWIVRFVMPRAFTLAALPEPNDSRVRLLGVAPSRIAVVRFSGLGGERDIARRTAQLETFVAARRLRAAGSPSLARYDPPWTPWFMRRNEIWIPLGPG